MLLNLPEEAKSLIENKGFSASRSDEPAGRCAIDMIREQNKEAKTRKVAVKGYPQSQTLILLQVMKTVRLQRTNYS